MLSSRLNSQSLDHALEKGLSTFRLEEATSYGSQLLKPIDFYAILKQENYVEIIQNLPVQQLYYSLKSQGVEENLEILEHISDTQFLRICDYSTFEQGLFNPKSLFKWMSLFKEISPVLMLNRFKNLDEEYQISALTPYVRMIDQETHDRMPEDEKDGIEAFPGNQIFYKLLTDDPLILETINTLLMTGLSEDPAYILNVFSQATFAVPHENEELLAQFQRARLEEDGFVHIDEAKQLFLPMPGKLSATIQNKYKGLKTQTPTQKMEILFAAIQSLSTEERERVMMGMSYLCNSISSLLDFDPSDIYNQKEVFKYQTGILNLSLEFLAGSDVGLAQKILVEESAKSIFQLGLCEMDHLRFSLWGHFPKNIQKKGKELFQLRKWAALQNFLDEQSKILGFEQAEILKGFYNRFPLIAISVDQSKFIFKPIRSLFDLNKAFAQCIELLNSKFKEPMPYASSESFTTREMGRNT